ncbi:6,7-dimethyl-8-ribityllumazine synthase [candidate division KSB1 bacterium]
MPNIINGKISAEGKKFGLVVSRFNELISSKLAEGAVDCIVRHKGNADEIDVIWVPGSFEIPPTAKKMVDKGKYDAVICLGAVIRGDTPHFEYISAEVTKGIALVGLDSKIPVVYGVLTTDSIDQAVERAGTKAGNKGFDAAMTAIEMIDLYSQI